MATAKLSRWRQAGGLVRAGHPGPCLVVGAAAAGVAAASGRRVCSAIGAGVAVLVGHLSIGWHNDWVDAPHDVAAGRDDKPLATGAVSRTAVAAAALSALGATVPLSLLSGRRAAGAHLGAVAIGWAYNAGLKDSGLSPVPFVVAFPLIVSFATLGGPDGRWPRPRTLACTALLTTGSHLLNGAHDIEADDRAGLAGLPQRLGRTTSERIGAGLVLGATAGLVPKGRGTGIAGLATLAAAAGAVGAGAAATARTPGSRALFRASLLVALLDVGLLLTRGV